jgi:hypothetical protein
VCCFAFMKIVNIFFLPSLDLVRNPFSIQPTADFIIGPPCSPARPPPTPAQPPARPTSPPHWATWPITARANPRKHDACCHSVCVCHHAEPYSCTTATEILTYAVIDFRAILIPSSQTYLRRPPPQGPPHLCPISRRPLLP